MFKWNFLIISWNDLILWWFFDKIGIGDFSNITWRAQRGRKSRKIVQISSHGVHKSKIRKTTISNPKWDQNCINAGSNIAQLHNFRLQPKNAIQMPKSQPTSQLKTKFKLNSKIDMQKNRNQTKVSIATYFPLLLCKQIYVFWNFAIQKSSHRIM